MIRLLGTHESYLHWKENPFVKVSVVGYLGKHLIMTLEREALTDD